MSQERSPKNGRHENIGDSIREDLLQEPGVIYTMPTAKIARTMVSSLKMRRTLKKNMAAFVKQK